MRFVNWDKLIAAFGDVATAPAIRENGEAEAFVTSVAGADVRVCAPLGAQVGRRLFKNLLIERGMAPEDWTLAGTNGLNVGTPAIAQLGSEALTMRFVMAATEVGREQDAATLVADAISLQRPSVPIDAGTAERIGAQLSEHVGLVDDAQAYIRSVPSDMDVIFASRDLGAQQFHFNMLIGDGFLEDAAVRDFCSDLVSADFYDPHYRSTALRDVEAAQAAGRSESYKLSYVNTWNAEHGLDYWRLRATIMANRLVFRVPFLAPRGGTLDLSRELAAINRVVANGFHYRGPTWQPIRGPSPLTMLGKHLAMEFLQRAFTSS